jgi:hypothetical protein
MVGATCHPATYGNERYSCGPGAAYAFVENGTEWTQQAELTPSDGMSEDSFGGSIAVSGSTALVGASRHPVGSQWPGAAYVFVESGGTWSQQEELTSSDGASEDSFGCSVAVGGSTAVVGAESHKVGSNAQQGVAYVFVESGLTWSQQAELTSSDGVAYDNFGSSVAIGGGTVVAGAPELLLNPRPGAAYVFVESGGTWIQQAELTASDGAAYDSFGSSIAVSGSTAFVGAHGHTVGSNQQQGAAYVFSSSATPSYALSASPSSLSVAQGGQGTSTITITPENGFSGSVSLSVSGLPNGVTAVFSPNPATSTSTLMLTANATAATGTTTVAATGASGSLTLTMPLTLTVTPSITLTLSSSSLNFGNEVIDMTSAAKLVTVTDSGNATLDISSITIIGDFAISKNTCGAGLAAGKKCQVEVTFTPTQLGRLTGTLTFADNGSNSPQTVALSGTGVLPATLTPARATYAAEKVDTTSEPKTFTLANNQTVAMTSIAISTTGDFAVSGTTCATSLGAKAQCTISVTFTPTVTGTRAGQLIVNDSASNSPQTSNLTGTGK